MENMVGVGVVELCVRYVCDVRASAERYIEWGYIGTVSSFSAAVGSSKLL